MKPERKLSRREFLRATAFMVSSMVIAACGPTPTPTATPPPVAKPAVTATPAPKPKEPVTLVYYSWGDEQKWASEKRCFAPFLNANPNIKIDFQGMAWGPYWQKILAGIAAGDPPDIFRMEAWKAHAYYARGTCLELTPYFEREKIDPATLWGRAEANTQCVYKDKWYGTPRGATGCDVMYYNRALFDKAGIPWPEKTPKWTWDDCLSVCKELTKDTNGDGKTDVWGIDTWKLGPDWNGGQEFVWNWGGEIFSKDGTKCLINTPEAIEGLQFLADLRNKHGVAPYPAQLPEGMGEAFMIGKTAMNHTGGFSVNVYKIIKDFDWGIAPVPAGPKGQVAYTKPNATVITKGSKHHEESWLLLKHINDEATVKCETLEGLWPPNRPEFMKAEWFLKRTTPPYDMSPTVPGLLVQARAPELHPWSAKIRQVMIAEFDPVWLGQKTVKDVAPIIEKKVNEILAGKDLPELS